jgi:hypothetical protein
VTVILVSDANVRAMQKQGTRPTTTNLRKTKEEKIEPKERGKEEEEEQEEEEQEEQEQEKEKLMIPTAASHSSTRAMTMR